MGNRSAMKFMDHLKYLSGRDQGDLGSAPKDRSLAGRKIVSIVELMDKLVNSPYNQTQDSFDCGTNGQTCKLSL